MNEEQRKVLEGVVRHYATLYRVSGITEERGVVDVVQELLNDTTTAAAVYICRNLTADQFAVLKADKFCVNEVVEGWAAFVPPYYAVMGGEVVDKCNDEAVLFHKYPYAKVYDSIGEAVVRPLDPQTYYNGGGTD